MVENLPYLHFLKVLRNSPTSDSKQLYTVVIVILNACTNVIIIIIILNLMGGLKIDEND